MGRLKKTEVEVPAAETDNSKPALKEVTAKHTIVYQEPLKIPVAEPEPEGVEIIETDDVEADDDDVERKNRPLSPRARLREKLAKLGVGNQVLKLRIDRLPQYDINGQSGINAEKDYIRTTQCTEAFFDGDDYLEHIRSIAGPGTYWLTLRGGKSVVAQWQERIGGPPLPISSAVENPTVEAYAPAPQVDGFTALLKQAKQFAELQKLFAPQNGNQSQAVANGEAPTAEQALLTLMNVDNTVVDTVASKLKGLFRSNNGGGEPERSWLDVLYIAIERDTLPKLINQFLPTALPRQQSAPIQQPTAQPEQQPQTVPPDQAAYERLMQLLLQSMRINGDVEPVLIAIDGFVALFPEHGPMVNSFVNAPAEMLLPGLAQASPAAAEIVALPHAKEWIEKLKAAYFPEDNEGKE